MAAFDPYPSCPVDAPAYALHAAYTQQLGPESRMPPPLLTQNLAMYSDLHPAGAQQQSMLTPLSASGSGSPYYTSFSDGTPADGMGSSLGLLGAGAGQAEPDTLLRLREEAARADRDEAKDDGQDQDHDPDAGEAGSALRGGLKPRGARRRIWTHALEKYLFTPHEIATLGAPHRRTIYLASLEAHIDRLHSQLLDVGLYPIDTTELAQYKGLNCKTAKGMVAGLQHDIASVRMRILEIERATRKTKEAARGQPMNTVMSNAGYPSSTTGNHGESQMSAGSAQQQPMHTNTLGGQSQQSHYPTARKFSLDSSIPPPSFPR